MVYHKHKLCYISRDTKILKAFEALKLLIYSGRYTANIKLWILVNEFALSNKIIWTWYLDQTLVRSVILFLSIENSEIFTVKLSATSRNLCHPVQLPAPWLPGQDIPFNQWKNSEKFSDIKFSANSENCEKVLHPAPWCPGHGIPVYPYWEIGTV